MKRPIFAIVLLVTVVSGYVIVNSRAASVVGDINNDGTVNVFDLSMLLTHWGTSDAASDINHDGTVNVFDLSPLLSHWSQTGGTPTPSAPPSPTPTPTPPVGGNTC